MNNTPFQVNKLEANVERMCARLSISATGILLSRLLLYLGRGMGSSFENQLRPFGLAEPEFRVLTALFSQPEGAAHPSELCARTSQRPANMSRISDALVGRGLITRVSSDQDRRKMVLRITAQGEDLVRRLVPTLVRPLDDLLSEFSADELQHLVSQLKRLASKLDAALCRHGAEPPT